MSIRWFKASESLSVISSAIGPRFSMAVSQKLGMPFTSLRVSSISLLASSCSSSSSSSSSPIKAWPSSISSVVGSNDPSTILFLFWKIGRCFSWYFFSKLSNSI
ncbi:hypothetical protein OGAPHI_003222 [Ogataea philodendri]|uniref:Uncharacterized protein n=1 Tax=Ogataea philodendri TaxID=1378263 RepID=A0A9P8P6L9_9ASCO|nr:uncharacterized protein OGAPHI_003222 [Ogataea philodendri]KAH3666773.1 hypothetical protein OGAPHI_003222 [Ogataea philodendri]